ncbi:MAG TPA: sodium:solute symporter [Gammaproteobacteria bacterium]|nr:sodium:solute symporter [Gammaproteobacteria bacterium]
MHTLDLFVIVAYLVVIATIGLRLSGRQRSASDYFVGERSLSWWAVCFSIVATETSTLTVISVPGVAYLGAYGYVELAFGYLIGRIIVAMVMLPLYMRGDLVSAYQYLGLRFGKKVQGLASVTFLVTRLLAEGVRLFAAAIPIALLLTAMGINASYIEIIIVLTGVTVGYTYIGGIRAVVWTDAIQMMLYVGGAILSAAILLTHTPLSDLGAAWQAGKFQVFNFHSAILTDPYAFVAAIFGGAVFTMASHGADQLMVQRILGCKSLADGRKAMIGSAIFVMAQFALFSFVGTLLWINYGGQTPHQLGLSDSDQLFPRFIIRQLPAGVSGLLIAGILGATMGSLSSAMNSMSNSTVTDLIHLFGRREYNGKTMLRLSRITTLVWAGALVGFASMFTDTNSPVIVLGLSITGYTYGALLGAFLLGLLIKRANQRDGAVAFVMTLIVMAVVVLDVKIHGQSLAFPWFVPIGAAITLLVGGGLSLTHPARKSDERPLSAVNPQNDSNRLRLRP